MLLKIIFPGRHYRVAKISVASSLKDPSGLFFLHIDPEIK